MTRDSIGFDRAAGTYDRTRAIPAAATAAVVELVGAEVGDRRCLEIGVGTGRIGRPLGEAGLRMVGLDLSESMLAQLVDNAGGSPPFPLVAGDATRLPFGDRALGAGLAVHVLHLIPDWRTVVDEVVRVIEPGGVFLAGVSRQGRVVRDIIAAVAARFGALDERHPGLTDLEELDAAMAERGAVARALPEVDVSRTATIERVVSTIEEQQWSWTWRYDRDELRDAAAEVRRWARDEFGGLDVEVATYAAMVFRAYDLARS